MKAKRNFALAVLLGVLISSISFMFTTITPTAEVDATTFKTVTATMTNGFTDTKVPNGYNGYSYKPVNGSTFDLYFDTVDLSTFDSTKAVFDFWLYLPEGDSYDFGKDCAYTYNRWRTEWTGTFIEFKAHCKFDFTNFEVKEGWNHIQLPLAPLMSYNIDGIKRVKGLQLWTDSISYTEPENPVTGMLVYGVSFKEVETPAIAVVEHQAIDNQTPADTELKNVVAKVTGGSTDTNVPKGYTGSSYKPVNASTIDVRFETVDVSSFDSTKAVFDFWLYLPEGDSYDFSKDCAYTYNRWITEWNNVQFKDHCSLDFTGMEVKEGWNHIQIPLAKLMGYNVAGIKEIKGVQLWTDSTSYSTPDNPVTGMLIYGISFKEVQSPVVAVIEYQEIEKPECDCCTTADTGCVCEKGEECNPECTCGGTYCNYVYKNVQTEVLNGIANSNTPNGYEGESFETNNSVKFVLEFETVDVTSFKAEKAVFDFWLFLPKGDTYDFELCGSNRWSTEWTGNYINFKTHCNFDFTNFEIKEGWNHLQIPLEPLMSYSADGIKRITGLELWADDFNTSNGSYENDLTGMLIYGMCFKEVQNSALAVLEYQPLPTSITLSTEKVVVTNENNNVALPSVTFGPEGAFGSVEYISENKYVANVVDGKVVGYVNGSTTITVMLVGDTNVSATFTVEVSGFAQAESLIVANGNEITMSPMTRVVLDVKPDVETPNYKLTYTSSNPEVVIVSSNGTLSAISEGTATINVKLEGSNVSTIIKVTVKELSSENSEASEAPQTSKGCGSSIQGSLMAFMVFSALAVLVFKKKN